MTEIVHGIESTTSDDQLNTLMFLQHAARAHGDQTVVTAMGDHTHRYTYAEMYERVKQAANALRSLGVEAGDAIGIYGYSTYRNVELLYAAGGLGVTPFIINMELPPEHQEFCIDHVRTHAALDVLCVDGELVGTLQDNAPDPDSFTYVVTRDDPAVEAAEVEPVGTYEDLIADEPAEMSWPTVHEDTAAILGFTSGTTGKPKAIAHSHRAIYLHNIGFVGGANVTPQDAVLQVPPLFHWGWNMWGFVPMSGATMVMPGPGYPDNLLDLVFSEDITFSAGVSTLFRRVAETAKKRQRDGDDVTLENLRVMFAGQTPPKDLMRDLEELGAETMQAYGYSESGGGAEFVYNVQGDLRDSELAMSHDELFDYKSEVAGYPVVGVSVKVLDVEDGSEQPWDGESAGEIAMKAPWCATGYWKMPERTAESRYGEYLKMGDFVTIDERANIRVLDRVKDAIKSGGEWIPSPTVEEFINEHEQVAESCVIAARHPEWGERPIVVIEPVEGVDPDDFDIDLAEHLQPYVDSGAIQKWWVPDRFVVDEIPITGTGKFNKKVLRDRYGDILLD